MKVTSRKRLWPLVAAALTFAVGCGVVALATAWVIYSWDFSRLEPSDRFFIAFIALCPGGIMAWTVFMALMDFEA